MALAMLAVPTVIVALVVVALVRLWERKNMPKPESLSLPVVSPFLGHGLIGLYFWTACVSGDTSQEKSYFISLLAWSCATMLFQIVWSAKKSFFASGDNRKPMAAFMALNFLAMSVGSIGVHITSAGEAWFAGCYTDADLAARAKLLDSSTNAVEAVEAMAQDEAMTQANPESEQCIINAQCGAMESAFYGAVGFALLLALCQTTCLLKCRVAKFPKSVTGWSIGLFFALDLIVFLFWTVCKASRCAG